MIIRYTHVPPVPDWRLKLLMQFEINEVSSQSGGEVAADYRRLNLPVEGGEETVLVSLARNTWLSPRIRAATSSGIKATGGCPCSVAAFNAFLQHGSWDDGETTYLVNIGRENIDMAIQRDGELLFARNMAGGGGMFTEAIMSTFGLREPKSEKNKVTKGDLTPKSQARYPDATSEKLANAMQGPAGQLVSMIQSSVMICRAQTKISDLNIDRLVLTGGTAAMKGIKQYFAANMSVPVELFDPIQEPDLSGLDPTDAQELGDQGFDFTVAVGLAESLIQSTAFRLEVLTESEKKKRQFGERTIWSLMAAVAALILVVLLFNTRASAITEVSEANERIRGTKKGHEKTREWQARAIAEHLDARQKEVALRGRRLPRQFSRAVLEALFSNHAKHIYLRRTTMTTRKISLDLECRPTQSRAAAGASEEAVRNIHAQQIWPEMEVHGVVQKEFTSQPDRTLQDYLRPLRATIAALDVEGHKVEMIERPLNADNTFHITFLLKETEKGKDG